MAKLLKLRRGTTSQHNTFTGAEGEVTIDTTKDTAVVHDGSTAGGRALAREDMSNVSSSSIAGRLGADAIATTKIAGGALPTDVTVASANIVGDAVNGSKIADNSINSEHYVDGSIDRVHLAADIVDGSKIANDSINSEHYVDASIDTAHIANNQVTYAKMGDIGGNTIMGRIGSSGGDPQSLTAANVRTIINVENGATADQSNAEIRAAVEAASDSNVFTDADHSKLNGIESGATADQSASEVLNLVKTVDGAGSGLDADTLDGAQPNTAASNSTIVQRNSNGYIFSNYINTTDNSVTSGVNGIICKESGQGDYHRTANAAAVRSFINVENGATADQSASEILTAIKTVDGSGSGLDADSLDGIDSSSFVRSDADDTVNATLTTRRVHVQGNYDIRFSQGNWTGEYGSKIQYHSNNLYCQYGSGSFIVRNPSGNNRFTVDQSGNAVAQGNVTAYSDARLKTDISTINDALGICGKLRGVSYKWIADGKAGIGVIAQEVEEVIPEVVVTTMNPDPATGEETEVKSVDYGKIVGVLINAINELKAEVEELKGGK